MYLPVAFTAKSDEIFFHIPSQMASRLHVMDLKICGIFASLASPTIAFENSATQPSIGVRVQSKPRSSRDE
jgi:hypothetical protein